MRDLLENSCACREAVNSFGETKQEEGDEESKKVGEGAVLAPSLVVAHHLRELSVMQHCRSGHVKIFIATSSYDRRLIDGVLREIDDNLGTSSIKECDQDKV